MPKQKFIDHMFRVKIIQTIVWILLEVAFFLVLICHPTLGKYTFDNPNVFILCCIAWLLSILGLLFLIYDIFRIRLLVNENHTLQRVAFLDSLAGIPNRHGLDTIFQTYTEPESLRNIGCFMTTITNLREVNLSSGREAGDNLIRNFSSILEKVGEDYGNIGRNGGNDFLAVIDSCDASKMAQFQAALQKEIDQYNTFHKAAPIQLDSVSVLNCELQATNFPALLAVTYSKLHKVR